MTLKQDIGSVLWQARFGTDKELQNDQVIDKVLKVFKEHIEKHGPPPPSINAWIGKS